MEITQTRTIPAPPDRVWQALNDPEVLRASVPGCESFERTGDNEYRATVAAKVGPVAARFVGKLKLADVVPPDGYTLRFEGQGGAAGFASGEAKVALASAPGDPTQTQLSYAVKAQVGGKIAQIGSRLVDGAAAKLADDFFARFSEQVAPRAEIATAAPAATPTVERGTRHWVRVVAIGVMLAILIYLYSRFAR